MGRNALDPVMPYVFAGIDECLWREVKNGFGWEVGFDDGGVYGCGWITSPEYGDPEGDGWGCTERMTWGLCK